MHDTTQEHDPMSIPEFTDTESHLVSQILFERYGRLVPFQAVEVDMLLDVASTEPTPCPALYWNQLGAEFIVAKVGDQRFRCQFFYSESEVFGTGRDTYDNLGDCVTNMLQLQADHHTTRAAALPQGAEKLPPTADEDYHGPVII
jgi:hypothetical protein